MMTPQTLDQEDVAFDGTPPIEVPHPMQVAGQPEATSTAENQAVEEPQACRFTWTIENFSRLTIKELYSEIFVVGGFKWRVVIFPKGNGNDYYLSMYLEVADSSSLPYGWSRFAQFSFAVVNQITNKLTVRKDTKRRFHARESDWGFYTFMPVSDFYDPGKGFLVNDTCIIEVDVVVRKLVNYRRKRAAKISTAKSTVISPRTPLQTGEGEKDIINNRKASNMADLDVDGSDDSSSSISIAKMRKIVHDVDEDDEISKGLNFYL